MASGVNVTLLLRTEGWQTDNGTGGSEQWAIMWIIIFCSVASYLAFTRLDLPYTFTTVWAMSGIRRMQTNEDSERFPIDDMSEAIAQWAGFASVVVIVFGVLAGGKLIYDAMRSRRQEPNASGSQPGFSNLG